MTPSRRLLGDSQAYFKAVLRGKEREEKRIARLSVEERFKILDRLMELYNLRLAKPEHRASTTRRPRSRTATPATISPR